MSQILFRMESLAADPAFFPWSLHWSLDDYIRFALLVGYDGVAYFPLRFRASRGILKNGVSKLAKDHVKVIYQAFRSERMINLWKHFYKPKFIASFLFTPHRIWSLNHISQFAKAIPGIPIVLYPPHVGKFAGRKWNEENYVLELAQRHPSSKLLVRPAPELIARSWLRNKTVAASTFAEASRTHGFLSFALNTKHIVRGPDPSQGFAPTNRFLELDAKEMDVWLFHSYIAHLNWTINGISEADKLLLASRKNLGWHGDIVLDIDRGVVRTMAHSKVISPNVLREIHTDLLGVTRNLLK